MGVTGVTAWLARFAVRRVHVLIVECPGEGALRMRAQAAIVGRGWVEAVSPADADGLLVCGVAEGVLPELVDAVWAQIPAPRHRVRVTDPAQLEAALDRIPAVLVDEKRQRADAADRPRRAEDQPSVDDAPAEKAPDSDDDGSMDMNMESGMGMDTGRGMNLDTDMNMDTGMDMDAGMDMDMSGPAGIPMASGDTDRDGLEMDITHLSIGPILTAWPADLIAHVVLHGDVVADARIERLHHPARPADPAPADRVPAAATLCDAAARLLVVAGWGPAALRLDRVRNDILAGVAAAITSARLHRVTTRVRRSRMLRWSLAGIPADPGLHSRLISWLDAAGVVLKSGDPGSMDLPDLGPAPTDAELREAMLGGDLTAARLVVAGAGVGRAPAIRSPHSSGSGNHV